ncbi:DUF1549 and DUF1553 domain-containing protein [Prosthecobacter sp.]|uniref:DUF1549 and DUF1553 domain-containing protein n=1 Tax=Prosthecobacter sp. TaxID=1965333 RepID=UPI002ABCE864|nr:DUF1549 and DUF1553 domain-containing protein [Prosthecobacter sp.]MDZ4404400.1 DUF1549 and DUF1553 domain-containing protein [Prosthecobacter sp.]
MVKRVWLKTPLDAILYPMRFLVFLALSIPLFAKPPTIKAGRQHWAFQPLSAAKPPAVKNTAWPKNDIDRFILAKLESNGLQPASEADPATLIRRITLDLTGLLPSPEEVEAFVNDCRQGSSFGIRNSSLEALADRLLASPRYGERWGRHWLDLSRYADTSGTHNDLDRPHAWKYRDYVIRSFNADKPYARFVAEQIAGDEIDGTDEQSLIATGFCRNGTSNDDNMGKNDDALAQYRADQLDDVISTTSSVFLGLTVGCARCHDHKTDPLLQRDYYSLLAIFNGTEKYGLVPGTQDKNDKRVKIDETAKVHALIETSPLVPTTRIMLRGSALNLGDEVGPAIPTLFKPIPFPSPTTKTSLRRKTLAEWITEPDNALAWRVIANRIWQHHFGKGLVASPSNFGFTGTKPTHPELLDYLAQQLIQNGGHFKALHKLILMSAAYRQSSSTGDNKENKDQKFSSPLPPLSPVQKDPGNSLLSRQNLQRMEAEVLRDSILTASGKLNPKLGGPGIKPRLRPDLLPVSQRNKWPVLQQEGPEQWRRSIYIYIKRQLLMPSMELFDAPTTTDSCAMRLDSTVPTQALVLMNDEFVEEQAAFLAQRATSGTLEKTIQRMFMLTLSHEADEKRLQQSLVFVKAREVTSTCDQALTDLAHVLLNSSEFIYIE